MDCGTRAGSFYAGNISNILKVLFSRSDLKYLTLQHIDQVYQYSSTLETLLFTQDLDKNILEIFEQFKALKA